LLPGELPQSASVRLSLDALPPARLRVFDCPRFPARTPRRHQSFTYTSGPKPRWVSACSTSPAPVVAKDREGNPCPLASVRLGLPGAKWFFATPPPRSTILCLLRTEAPAIA